MLYTPCVSAGQAALPPSWPAITQSGLCVWSETLRTPLQNVPLTCCSQRGSPAGGKDRQAAAHCRKRCRTFLIRQRKWSHDTTDPDFVVTSDHCFLTCGGTVQGSQTGARSSCLALHLKHRLQSRLQGAGIVAPRRPGQRTAPPRVLRVLMRRLQLFSSQTLPPSQRQPAVVHVQKAGPTELRDKRPLLLCPLLQKAGQTMTA